MSRLHPRSSLVADLRLVEVVHTDRMSGLEAARELSRLLADPARPYRYVWERRGAAYRGRSLNQTSVAKVLAAYLVDRGLLADFEEEDWPRARRDWVRSRLAGDVLTHLELELFMDAFGIIEVERERLRRHLDERAATGSGFGVGDIRLAGLPDRTTYAVERAVDQHSLGPSGLPLHHRTTATLRARADQVSDYLYLFDASVGGVEVVKGGTAGTPRQVGDGVWGVVITLEEPLAIGETADLTYETTFAYLEPPPPRLRRAGSAHLGVVEMSVSFHPDRLPGALHQSTWNALADDEPATCVPLELDLTHSVTATWVVARSGLVGFSWTW